MAAIIARHPLRLQRRLLLALLRFPSPPRSCCLAPAWLLLEQDCVDDMPKANWQARCKLRRRANQNVESNIQQAPSLRQIRFCSTVGPYLLHGLSGFSSVCEETETGEVWFDQNSEYAGRTAYRN